MRGLHVPLDERERRALLDIADDQDRDAKRQARRFIREGLIRAGALKDDERSSSYEPEPATR